MTLRAWLGSWLIAAAACGSGEPGAGALRASWIGADTATFTADGAALWCSEPRWLELTAQRGDTGVGLVIYPADGPHLGGVYGVSAPDRDSAGVAAPPSRPAGAMALRWVTPQAVEGFEGISGRIRITEGDQGITGTFEGLLRSVAGDDTVAVDGRFRGLLLIRDGVECQPPDTASTSAPAPPAG